MEGKPRFQDYTQPMTRETCLGCGQVIMVPANAEFKDLHVCKK